jgi:hypothetical protein
MDVLLNGIFFKCFYCKVLNRITSRETITTNIERINNNNNFVRDISDQNIRGLFQTNQNNDNNIIPINNLFSRFDSNGTCKII